MIVKTVRDREKGQDGKLKNEKNGWLGRAIRFFVYTMSQVQICACTRICTWRMYIIELLSEIVYKVYESSRSQPTRLSYFMMEN